MDIILELCPELLCKCLNAVFCNKIYLAIYLSYGFYYHRMLWHCLTIRLPAVPRRHFYQLTSWYITSPGTPKEAYYYTPIGRIMQGATKVVVLLSRT